MPKRMPMVDTADDAASRQRELAWEAECIAEARLQLDAGYYVDADDVDAWINSIGTPKELPPPPTKRR